jgi:pectinesterase inhibitor-like protein
MARLVLAAVFVFVYLEATAVVASPAASAPSELIRRSCRETQYPSVCVQSLSAYRSSPPPRSPQELAHAALAVSADRARAASAYVGGAFGGQGGPVRDCLENMADSVGHLRDAAREMGGASAAAGSPAAFKWRLDNVQAWCSAALTDETTCIDGLARGVDAPTRAAIRGKVVDVAQVTSNALALVNRVGPGH